MAEQQAATPAVQTPGRPADLTPVDQLPSGTMGAVLGAYVPNPAQNVLTPGTPSPEALAALQWSPDLAAGVQDAIAAYQQASGQAAAQQARISALEQKSAPELAAYQQRAGALLGQMQAAAGAYQNRPPLPEPPPVQEFPPAPRAALKPFTSVYGKTTMDMVSQVVQKLAAIAPLFGRGAPQAALASYTGALEGWAEGSREKADFAMKKYALEMKKTIAMGVQQQQRYTNLLAKYGYDDQKLSALMGVYAAELGVERDKLKMAIDTPAQFVQMHGQALQAAIEASRLGLQAYEFKAAQLQNYQLAQQHIELQRQQLAQAQERLRTVDEARVALEREAFERGAALSDEKRQLLKQTTEAAIALNQEVSDLQKKDALYRSNWLSALLFAPAPEKMEARKVELEGLLRKLELQRQVPTQ